MPFINIVHEGYKTLYPVCLTRSPPTKLGSFSPHDVRAPSLRLPSACSRLFQLMYELHCSLSLHDTSPVLVDSPHYEL
eukprot:672381-Hanusia_phi.AAC.2